MATILRYVRENGRVASAGQGVMELRIDKGPGYRVYYGLVGDALIVLLAGGDKSSQTRDAQKARRYWKDWKGRQV